ncbi:BTAD domain-containing putative transcriptional regulator [Krasilnikovia sp. MM14-A1259]|uniref:BTAD domain-containing putative transcriptional regulator n=1 Tax=Krasilnikovia sp. MM14-A1259 TaxID=3373539 RepID=UPI00382113D1
MFRVVAALGRLLRALAALAALISFLACVPWLLTASSGWPLDWIGWPSLAQVPDLSDLYTTVTSPWSDQMILDLLASIGWVLWLIFLRDVLVEVIEASAATSAARRGRLRAPVVRRGPIRWVAAVLVGAIVGAVLFDAARAAVTGTATPSAAAAAADAAARRPAVAVAPAQRTVAPAVIDSAWVRSLRTGDVSTAAPTKAAAPAHEAADRDVPAWARDAPGGVHHVVRGDNLWDIAEHQLGDPHRWREIYTLNRGHEQANGYALTDPDEIHVGWVLAMPTRDTTAAPVSATPAAEPPPVTPAPGSADAGPAPHGSANPSPGSGDAGDAPQAPAATRTEAPSSPPVSTAPTPSSSVPAGSASSAAATPTASATDSAAGPQTSSQRDEAGVSLPSQGWVSLGLAALIASVASLLRLQRRRRARLGFPIPARLAAQPTPVPEPLTPADTAGARHLAAEEFEPHRPPLPAVLAPIGVDAGGAEVSLFDLPAPGLAVTGDGAEAAARAVLASVLATGATEILEQRPVVVTTVEVLARLLPEDAPLVGLDPDGTTYDGERLIVLDEVAAAVTHAEEEMIVRRRLLDTFHADSITALNARTDHAEAQQPYVLLIEAAPRHAARLLAVGAHKAALHLHPVILGPLDRVPTVDVTADGTVNATTDETADVRRMSTLTGDDLAAVMTMLTDAAARPELGHDTDDPTPQTTPAAEAPTEPAEPVPAQAAQAPGVVRLTVLGPMTVATEAGPVTTGMRSGSYAVLALLAVHPGGRTLDQLGADLHPDTNPSTAANRVRTDIGTIRRVLRAATGQAEAMFVIHDSATGRYRLDPDLVTVDLWQMLTAIEHANSAEDDAAALAALREAAELYAGDFADGGDQTWITDYATTYRHQILAVYARIAEIVEPDHPDQAVAALERALEFDPVNEELYQRIMRIHGRAGRPDVVRRTLRRLEQRLADLGDAEPSQATRRVAERQLRPNITTGGRR